MAPNALPLRAQHTVTGSDRRRIGQEAESWNPDFDIAPFRLPGMRILVVRGPACALGKNLGGLHHARRRGIIPIPASIPPISEQRSTHQHYDLWQQVSCSHGYHGAELVRGGLVMKTVDLLESVGPTFDLHGASTATVGVAPANVFYNPFTERACRAADDNQSPDLKGCVAGKAQSGTTSTVQQLPYPGSPQDIYCPDYRQYLLAYTRIHRKEKADTKFIGLKSLNSC